MDTDNMGVRTMGARETGAWGMANPGLPIPEPLPGGIPGDLPTPPLPDEQPDIGPTGPRTPYPVNDPGIDEPAGPGSEPDYLPGGPTDPGVRM